MAHPVFWPKQTFFYPVGNTSPICLTDYLPPEQDARILLLGCGDTRNILHTIYMNGPSHNRQLDFTCCDIEPAILARNVILLTLLADADIKFDDPRVWNIYYHFLLDDASLSLLLSQCKRLLDMAKDIETWNSGPFASFIRICSQHTFTELRRLWTLYAQTSQWSDAHRNAFKQKFASGMLEVAETHQNVGTGIRCAGPFSLEVEGLASEAHSVFWRSGTTSPDGNASLINPMFAFSAQGEGCMAHYGTCPLYAFHLAPAFAHLEGARRNTKKATLKSVYAVIQHQFQYWCAAFKACLATRKVVIRLIIGDVLAVCYAFQHLSSYNSVKSHHLVSSWRASPLTLVSDEYASHGSRAPTSFDVIDTSNLSDHTGMLNILIAATPLLSLSPFSTLNTETLLPTGKNPSASFADRLCGDIASVSIMLGLAPITFVSGFSSQSNIHEILQHGLAEDGNRQYHERIVWKQSSCLGLEVGSCTSIAMEDGDAITLLCSIYRRMFIQESIVERLRATSMQAICDLSSTHYCRQSFAALVTYAKRAIKCDWQATIERLLSSIREDKELLVGLNYYQDLVCQLHLMGTYTDPFLHPSHPLLAKNRLVGRLRSWNPLPPVVCIVFIVPRHKLDILERSSACPTPNLEVHIASVAHEDAFSSIRMVFGSVSHHGGGVDGRITITEDPLGKRGRSPAVVAFWVPSWILAVSPDRDRVSLCVHSTPKSAHAYVAKLGLRLELHSVRLMDTDAIHIVGIPPIVERERSDFNFARTPALYHTLSETHSSPSPSHTVRAQLGPSSDAISRFISHQDFAGSVQDVLSDPTTEVKQSQTAPTVIQLSIGPNYTFEHCFPYPVDGRNVRLRVARKSSWVEIMVDISRPKPLACNPYPIAVTNSLHAPWNIHRVNLARLPVLDTSEADECTWINTHIPFMLSDRERHTLNHNEPSHIETLSHVKHTILSMYQGFLGTRGKKRVQIFGLHDTSENSVGTLIFLTQLRLDLASHTIIADGYVLPLDEMIIDRLIPHLSRALPDTARIHCDADEIKHWLCLIPGLVERCRDWSHKKDCAFLREGNIPLSFKHGEKYICDCGRGIIGEDFRSHREWAPFAPYVAKIAISPLFAVSYLDPVVKDLAQRCREWTKEKDNGAHTSATRQEYRSCSYCNNRPTGSKAFMLCSRCKQAAYCNKNCQTTHWKEHKRTCVRK